MTRVLFRAVLALLGGIIAAKLIETFLTSERGQRLAARAGLSDLTTHRGVELAQKYARAMVGSVAAAVSGIQEGSQTGPLSGRQPSWPDRVQTIAHYLLAVGALAKTVSDFLEERRQMLGEELPRA